VLLLENVTFWERHCFRTQHACRGALHRYVGTVTISPNDGDGEVDGQRIR
jgi:hypothetical protein